MMMDPDVLRKLTSVSPARHDHHQVSPGTMQEILDTGDQSLIDQAMDQMGVDDLTAYLESLPSPIPMRFSGRVPCRGRVVKRSHPVDRSANPQSWERTLCRWSANAGTGESPFVFRSRTAHRGAQIGAGGGGR